MLCTIITISLVSKRLPCIVSARPATLVDYLHELIDYHVVLLLAGSPSRRQSTLLNDVLT